MKESPRRMSRKEREFLQRREAILATALNLFAERGFHKVSMSEIARESEFSVGSLYNFFPNKESLYKALILENTARICRDLERVTESEGQEIRTIQAWVEKKVELFRKNSGFFRLFFSETVGINAVVKVQISDILKERQRDLRNRLAHQFDLAMETGQIPRMASGTMLAIALDGACNTLLSAEAEGEAVEPVTADSILRLFAASQPIPTGGASKPIPAGTDRHPGPADARELRP